MASVRQIANCIGVSGNFSIRRDFFGYTTTVPGPVSLLTQLRLLRGSHIHLNLIRVASGGFSAGRLGEINAALQSTRDTYATVKMGVGRVKHFSLPDPEAFVHQDVADNDEALALTQEWTIGNDGIDVFVVRTIAGSSIGKSPTPGVCDKDDGKEQTGCVCSIEDAAGMFALSLAHEVGHYLGLPHVSGSPTNLMSPSAPNGGRLGLAQGAMMKLHCFVRPGC